MLATRRHLVFALISLAGASAAACSSSTAPPAEEKVGHSAAALASQPFCNPIVSCCVVGSMPLSGYDESGTPLPCQQLLLAAGCPPQQMRAFEDNGDGTGVFAVLCPTARWNDVNAAVLNDACQGNSETEDAFIPMPSNRCIKAPPAGYFWGSYDPTCPGGGCCTR